MITLAAALFAGCATFLPTIGPSRWQIDPAKPPPDVSAIQIIDIDDGVTRQALAQRALHLFSETLGDKRISSRTVGAGDVLGVSIWEAAPATLSIASTNTSSSTIATSHLTTLPEQPVDADGFILVPFAGLFRQLAKYFKKSNRKSYRGFVARLINRKYCCQ